MCLLSRVDPTGCTCPTSSLSLGELELEAQLFIRLNNLWRKGAQSSFVFFCGIVRNVLCFIQGRDNRSVESRQRFCGFS